MDVKKKPHHCNKYEMNHCKKVKTNKKNALIYTPKYLSICSKELKVWTNSTFHIFVMSSDDKDT